MTDISIVAGTSVPLDWTDNQGTSADGYSYSIIVEAEDAHFVPQLQTRYETVEAAQDAAQADYDTKRRADAWQQFFLTHEPPA